MICRNCGKEIGDNSSFCPYCGENCAPTYDAWQQPPVDNRGPVYDQGYADPSYADPNYSNGAQQQYYQQPAPQYNIQQVMTAPAQEVKTGRYFLWHLVAYLSFCEIVCFILSIVFAVSSSDRNRSNYFKAVWIYRLIGFVLLAIAAVIIFVIIGVSFDSITGFFSGGGLEDLLDEFLLIAPHF